MTDKLHISLAVLKGLLFEANDLINNVNNSLETPGSIPNLAEID